LNELLLSLAHALSQKPNHPNLVVVAVVIVVDAVADRVAVLAAVDEHVLPFLLPCSLQFCKINVDKLCKIYYIRLRFFYVDLLERNKRFVIYFFF
jgi:hypothetical protein